MVFDQTGPGTGIRQGRSDHPGWMMLDSIPAGGRNTIELGPETPKTKHALTA
jgi:hypothetical protein